MGNEAVYVGQYKFQHNKSSKRKFKNVRVAFKDRTYDSKMEARFAQRLELLQRSGEIKSWEPQVSFVLPGKIGNRRIIHRVDFKVIENDGRETFYEVKGVDHQVGKIKRAQVEEIYGIKINLIRSVK